MCDNNKRINWEEIFNLYNTIKWLYALCEETDTELNTNLQPFNEFRAALDHLMRIVAIENLEEYKEKDANDEAKRLRSHLRRALFDICDMISINYRNKIIDVLKEYKVEEIQSALPNYYSEIRPRIEEISEEIASLRTEKRFNGDKKEETAVDDYPKVIEELQGYYKVVNAAVPSLIEIREKQQEAEAAVEKKDFVIKWIIPIATFITGLVIGILSLFL